MVYLYILEGIKGKHYIGITSVGLRIRLAKHNKGEVFSTRLFRPWKIIYSEAFKNFISARKREIQIKSWHGGNAFKKLISRATGSSNR